MLTFELHETTPISQARGVVAALLAIYGDTVLHIATSRQETYATVQAGGSAPSHILATTANAIIDGGEENEPDAASVMTTDTPFVPASPQAAGAVDRDIHGIPYDARIHSDRGGSTGGKNQDGSWKRKRNTPDDLFATVMAELKAANTAHTLQAAAAGGVIPLPPGSAATTTANVPSPPPVAGPASSIDAGGSISFPDLMKKVSKALDDKTLDNDVYKDLLAGQNVSSITGFMSDAGKRNEFNKLLDLVIGA